MSYNSKAIKTDVNAKPIPQYFNPVTDEYEVLLGTGGAARQVLYGPDGQPISTTEGKLAVRAAELETAISNLQTALGSQSTAAKQDALAGLVGAIDAAAVSDPAAAGAVIALLKGVLSRLQAVEGKIDGITDGTAPAKTELTGSIATTVTEGKLAVRAAELEAKIEAVRVLLNALAGEDFATQTTLAQILGKMIAAPATEAKQDSLATLVGAIEDKLDGVIDGTTPAKTELMGSKVELKKITLSDASEVAAGGEASIQTVVPDGKIWTIQNIDMIIRQPDNATTGTHYMRIYAGAEIAIVRAPYNKRLQYTYGAFVDGSQNLMPIEDATPKEPLLQTLIFKGVKISKNMPLQIRYVNATDVVQTNQRTINLSVLEECITS